MNNKDSVPLIEKNKIPIKYNNQQFAQKMK